MQKEGKNAMYTEMYNVRLKQLNSIELVMRPGKMSDKMKPMNGHMTGNTTTQQLVRSH